MEQQFRKGDRVRIAFRDYDQGDYKFEFTDEMAELSGREFTIGGVENHYGTGHEHEVEDDGFAYYLKEEPANRFTWSSGMLEHVFKFFEEEDIEKNKKDIKEKIKKILYSSVEKDCKTTKTPNYGGSIYEAYSSYTSNYDDFLAGR